MGPKDLPGFENPYFEGADHQMFTGMLLGFLMKHSQGSSARVEKFVDFAAPVDDEKGIHKNAIDVTVGKSMFRIIIADVTNA